MCTSVHPAPGHHSPTDQSKRLNPLPGGQRVAGSNPAVPTGNMTFFEYTSTTQEPTKEPTCCATPPPQARTAPTTAPHQGRCHDSRTGKLTNQGAKDHRATPDLHDDPGQQRTGRHHPPPTR